MANIKRYIPKSVRISEEGRVAIEAAIAGGVEILRAIGGEVWKKTGMSNVVNEADLASGQAIRKVVRARFQNDPILSEEHQDGEPAVDKPLEIGRFWVIDELDGSKNFADKIDNVWVSIAFVTFGKTQVGVAYNPFNKSMYFAQKGEGAFYVGLPYGGNIWGSERLHVSQQTDLSSSSIETSIAYDPKITLENRRILLSLVEKGLTPRIREIGSSVEQLCRVASGKSDLHFHESLEPGDYAAGQLIIEEAGGVCVGADGTDFNFMRQDNVSGNPILVEKFLKFLKEGK